MSYLRFVVALVVSGCGLIDSDVTNFDLTLRDKAFTVDASGWQVNQSAADQFLMMQCTQGPQNVCTAAAATACPMNCTGTCGTTNRCELALDVGVYQMIDLVTEQPELKSINDRAVISVTVDSVSYRVSQNTLNTDTPEMKVYVAPMSIMDPDDPMARQIGTIPAVAAGQTVAAGEMMFVTGGREILVETMGRFQNPFNVIVGSRLEMQAGDMVPTGRLDAVVTIKAHAGL
jgi:hypothetical protein